MSGNEEHGPAEDHQPDGPNPGDGDGDEGRPVAVKVDPDAPAAEAVRAALAEGLAWLRLNGARAKAGEAEGVHHLRVTTRRLRTALALLRDLTDPQWADGLSDELRWLGGLLGGLRDLDVMTERLRAEADGLGADAAAALAPLFDDLAGRRDGAARGLAEALNGERFARLADALADAVAHTPSSPAAGAPCREALPPPVREAWAKLKGVGRALRPDDPDEAFHEVRKWAKRARYAAEAVGAALGPDAARDAGRFARRARKVQDVLGAHQDAVVCAALLRDAAAARRDDGAFGYAAGRLTERQHQAEADARAAFFPLWDRLDRKKCRRWLKP